MMRGTAEIENEVSESKARTAWTFAYELAVIVTILLCLTWSARAQETVAASAPKPSIRKIMISVPDHKLALIADGQIVKVYPVATGAEGSPTPSGEFQIVNRLTSPTYYHPGKVIGPGDDNPLGTRWMGLNAPHLGIHGTNVPNSIGKPASHGCVRMSRKDLEELFELVRVGDTVVIRGERTEEIAGVFNRLTPDRLTLNRLSPGGEQPVVAADAGGVDTNSDQ
jgi:L,D-transpeptidase catalytic domain